METSIKESIFNPKEEMLAITELYSRASESIGGRKITFNPKAEKLLIELLREATDFCDGVEVKAAAVLLLLAGQYELGIAPSINKKSWGLFNIWRTDASYYTRNILRSEVFGEPCVQIKAPKRHRMKQRKYFQKLDHCCYHPMNYVIGYDRKINKHSILKSAEYVVFQIKDDFCSVLELDAMYENMRKNQEFLYWMNGASIENGNNGEVNEILGNDNDEM